MTRVDPLPSRHLFRVSRHAGVWRLIHNGVFYRDYVSEGDAVAAAHAAADRERAFGHQVQVVTPEPEPAPLSAAALRRDPYTGA